MKLPLLISVPHAGCEIPAELEQLCLLTHEQIVRDGDVGARQIYAIDGHVEAFATTNIARAAVDLNRAESDRREDGVVKTHTCWRDPVYREPLPEPLVETLLGRYHHPYHRRLTELARSPRVRLGLDCHTMAAVGPPIGPGPGIERPPICLSNGSGATCSDAWLEHLASCMRQSFGHELRLNDPFVGGHIVRTHARELPWIQIEMSRAPFLDLGEKRRRLISALVEFCSWLRS